MLEEQGVLVTMHGASWHRLLPVDSESVLHGTHVSLNYTLNLDPDPMADHRDYLSLGDHARLYVTFGQQFSRRPGQWDTYVAELRGAGHVSARTPNRHGQAVFAGTEVDGLLEGEGDLTMVLRDAAGAVLREDRITRSDLRQVDALMRRLTSQMAEMLTDPARLCAPQEEIVVT